MRWRVFVGLILMAPALLAEPVYRQTDDRGHPVFTDQPDADADAEPVDLPAVNVTPAVDPRRDVAAPEREGMDHYRVFEIDQPQAIVPNGLAGIEVAVKLDPGLRPGHRLRVLLDGEMVAAGDQPTLAIGQLPRGSHTLEVQLLERGTQRILRSARRNIFVYWPGGNR